jgi:hypothetical protein
LLEKICRPFHSNAKREVWWLFGVTPQKSEVTSLRWIEKICIMGWVIRTGYRHKVFLHKFFGESINTGLGVVKPLDPAVTDHIVSRTIALYLIICQGGEMLEPDVELGRQPLRLDKSV